MILVIDIKTNQENPNRMIYKHLFFCILSAFFFVSEQASAYTKLKSLPEYNKVSKQLFNMLETKHYSKPILDDQLSKMAFGYYINSLDPTKSFFLQSDVDQLSKYKNSFCEALRKGNTQVAYTIYNLYQKRSEDRLKEIEKNIPNMVKRFNYTKKETLSNDPNKRTWAKNEKELSTYWHKRIKNSALTLLLSGDKNNKIIATLQRRYKNQLHQLKQTKSADIYQIFANSITATLDPHTNYFAPRASESFNISMSLSLDGIGAVLQADGDYTKVVRLIPGGPADRQTDLEPNDKIVAVGQQGKSMIDIIGMRLDDVVDMIRGPRNTKVKLKIIPTKGGSQTRKTIIIERKKVKLEDQSAKKDIIDVKHDGKTYRIGIIHLPTFYSDFAAIQAGDKNYKSSTRDTRKLIDALKKEGIVGLILDLRNNGGGSLQEAIGVAGLFIPSGPIVQIRDKNSHITVLGDDDKTIAYGGPLVVLANRMSASASEIVTGALKDYGRALIIGNRTFGKGTVQVLQDLSLGQLKITQAKFYRISGESTQNKGVIPDIKFPSLIDTTKIGESALKQPLPWDNIRSTRYPIYWDMKTYDLILNNRHDQRIRKDPDFIAVKDQIKAYKEQKKKYKTISLNEKISKSENSVIKKQELDIENTRRKALGLKLINSMDEVKTDDNKRDSYAEEASNILLDFITINQKGVKKVQSKQANSN